MPIKRNSIPNRFVNVSHPADLFVPHGEQRADSPKSRVAGARIA